MNFTIIKKPLLIGTVLLLLISCGGSSDSSIATVVEDDTLTVEPKFKITKVGQAESFTEEGENILEDYYQYVVSLSKDFDYDLTVYGSGESGTIGFVQNGLDTQGKLPEFYLNKSLDIAQFDIKYSEKYKSQWKNFYNGKINVLTGELFGTWGHPNFDQSNYSSK